MYRNNIYSYSYMAIVHWDDIYGRLNKSFTQHHMSRVVDGGGIRIQLVRQMPGISIVNAPHARESLQRAIVDCHQKWSIGTNSLSIEQLDIGNLKRY